MGIQPEASHHEEGPGQNEIDFHYSDALTAADHTSTFKWVVEMVASGNGLEADFSPKPLADHAGNGMHINLSLPKNPELQEAFLAGILDHICEMTVFFNPHKDSFLRLGEKKAPRFVSWSKENRSTLIRIPAVKGGQQRIELRSPDPMANPYLCYALLIYAGIDGIQKHRKAPQAIDVNLYTAQRSVTDLLQKLPTTHAEAWNRAAASDFYQTIYSCCISARISIRIRKGRRKSMPNYSILVVSKSEIPMQILKELLPKDQYNILFSSTIAQTQRLLIGRKIDLLIIDMPLKEESGLRFAQSIAQRSMSWSVIIDECDIISYIGSTHGRSRRFQSLPSPFHIKRSIKAFV